jgi:hypothetical protein
VSFPNLLTERDNKTHCPVRVGTFGAALVYHVAAAWMVIGQGDHITMAMLGQYILHMGGLCSVGVAGVALKSASGADAPPPEGTS